MTSGRGPARAGALEGAPAERQARSERCHTNQQHRNREIAGEGQGAAIRSGLVSSGSPRRNSPGAAAGPRPCGSARIAVVGPIFELSLSATLVATARLERCLGVSLARVCSQTQGTKGNQRQAEGSEDGNSLP